MIGWVFWLHRWVPLMAVAVFVAWLFLHHRLEAGLGDTLRRQWTRAWPPGPVVLTALLCASTLAFVFHDASAVGKIMPIGLSVVALSMVLFGAWWTLVALPRWLGGAGRVTLGSAAPPRAWARASNKRQLRGA